MWMEPWLPWLGCPSLTSYSLHTAKIARVDDAHSHCAGLGMKQKEVMGIANKRMNMDMKLPQRKRTPGLTAGRFQDDGLCESAGGQWQISALSHSCFFSFLLTRHHDIFSLIAFLSVPHLALPDSALAFLIHRKLISRTQPSHNAACFQKVNLSLRQVIDANLITSQTLANGVSVHTKTAVADQSPTPNSK
jgi:hypothetical protein